MLMGPYKTDPVISLIALFDFLPPWFSMHTHTKKEQNKAPDALPVFPLLSGRGVYPPFLLEVCP